MIQTCLDDCTKVASPYKEFNLLVVANMSEQKTPLDLWGATETTFNSSEKWKILTTDFPLGCHGKHLQLIRNKTSIQCTPGSQIYLSSKKIILEQKKSKNA